MREISVVIPSYNEEKNIAETAAVLSEVLAGEDYELVFVDDGSEDGTYAAITALAQQDARVVGVRFSRNFGKEAAIFAGLRAAQGKCAVVTDCDLQFPPETIPEMLSKWREGYLVIEGKKRARGKESTAYRAFSKLFYSLISMSGRFDMRDSSDFKLLDRRVIDELLALPERDTFFRALSFWTGFRSATVWFTVQPRAHGVSKWSLKKLAKYAVDNITSFTTAPLKVVTLLGGILLACSAVLAVETLVRFFLGLSVEGFTTVILLLLIIGGAIMVSLGVIGYYVARIFDEVKERPRYIVAETTDKKGDRQKTSENEK